MIEIELESYFKIAIWGSPVVVLFLLILSAFFSGSETALTASSRPKLRSMSDRGSNGAKKALDITNDNESLIGTILLGNNIVNILATSFSGQFRYLLFISTCFSVGNPTAYNIVAIDEAQAVKNTSMLTYRYCFNVALNFFICIVYVLIYYNVCLIRGLLPRSLSCCRCIVAILIYS